MQSIQDVAETLDRVHEKAIRLWQIVERLLTAGRTESKSDFSEAQSALSSAEEIMRSYMDAQLLDRAEEAVVERVIPAELVVWSGCLYVNFHDLAVRGAYWLHCAMKDAEQRVLRVERERIDPPELEHRAVPSRSVAFEICKLTQPPRPRVTAHLLKEEYLTTKRGLNVLAKKVLKEGNKAADRERRRREHVETKAARKKRDAFMYQEYMRGTKLWEIIEKVLKHKEWPRITTLQSVLPRIDSYAKRHGLPKPPRRRRPAPKREGRARRGFH